MTNVVPFIFEHDQEQTPIRTLKLNGDLWFVAVDACRALGLENTTAAVRGLDADEKSTITNSKGGPDLIIISEPGLYKLIQGSRKPAAKTFDRFVRHEILPAYRSGELTALSRETDLLTAINSIAATQKEMQTDIGDIKVKLNGGREKFSRDTVRYVGEGVAKHNNCECIYCNNADVVTKWGEKLDNRCHEHHADGNRANIAPDNCTLPCIECHKRLTNKKDPDHIPVHLALGIASAFHLKVKQKAARIKPPSASAALKHWDFRAATQADMGWPNARKKSLTLD